MKTSNKTITIEKISKMIKNGTFTITTDNFFVEKYTETRKIKTNNIYDNTLRLSKHKIEAGVMKTLYKYKNITIEQHIDYTHDITAGTIEFDKNSLYSMCNIQIITDYNMAINIQQLNELLNNNYNNENDNYNDFAKLELQTR